MPKRNWGGEFAVGLVAGGTLVFVILVFWYGPTCSPNYPCGYPHDQETNNGSVWYDTAAQWLAALTGIAVAVFTFWTVLLVRKALAADDAALHESREQTKIARAQVSAYVNIQSVSCIIDEYFLQLMFNLRNGGASKASKINIAGAVRVYNKTNLLDLERPNFTALRFECVSGIIDQGGDAKTFVIIPHTEFPPGEFDRIHESSWVDVDCRITWNDIFGTTHNERHILSPNGFDKNKLAVGKVRLQSEIHVTYSGPPTG